MSMYIYTYIILTSIGVKARWLGLQDGKPSGFTRNNTLQTTRPPPIREPARQSDDGQYTPTKHLTPLPWPLQDIRLLRGCCARINHPFTPPRPPALPTLVQYSCTIIGQYTTPLPTSRLYAIHHAILVIAISCEGQPLPHHSSRPGAVHTDTETPLQ